MTTSDSTIEVLQGELERLFELDELLKLSAEVLGFDPDRVGGTTSKGAFARSLVGYCADQEAMEALVDAILLSSDQADSRLRTVIASAPNGELRPGTRVGDLRIVKKIGEGGLSVVYLAETDADAPTPRRAALKVIRPQYARDRGAVHRFTTASRIMQALQSPGLVPILGVGQLEDARPWVAATFLSGQTLAQRIARTGSLHINEARPIFAGVLEGLAALHKRGLFHGDIKAENVFVVRPGPEEGAAEPTGVLVDAGGDRLLTRLPVTATMTGLLSVFGTAKALAPEQARGLELDARSDIYQMGTLMYETLTGRAPFIGSSAIDVIAQHLSAQPEPPSAHARKGWVSPALDAVVLRALAKQPGERFTSADALLDAIESAVRRPAGARPLDEGAFQDARRGLLLNPDEAHADRLEELARESNAFSRAADALLEAANATRDQRAKVDMLLRLARICDTELEDAIRAESAYQQILELVPGDAAAQRGLEAAKRASGDHEGLVGLLLDRLEHETQETARKSLLHEVATLYEKQLRDPDNALIAWTQALLGDPFDQEALRQIERIGGNDEARFGEVLGALDQWAQATQATLTTDEDAALDAARQAVDQAQAAYEAVRAELGAQLQARESELSDAHAHVQSRIDAAEQALAQAKARAEEIDAQLTAAATRASELSSAADADQAAADDARRDAEAHVEAFEALEQEAGEQPSEEQQSELARIAAEAEALVSAAEAAEQAADAAAAELETARAELLTLQEALESAQGEEAMAAQALDDEREAAAMDGAPGAQYTAEEREQLAFAERALEAARAELAEIEARGEDEAAKQRARDIASLAQVYVLMGRLYGDRLNRPDFALSCFSQALAIEPSQAAAYDGVIDLYRGSQSWPELSNALLQRADNEQSPVKARDYRAEAAIVIAGKLNDLTQARAQLERVLADDPHHPQAQRALSDILREQQDFPALAQVLEQSAESQKGKERLQALLSLGELYEDRLGELEAAASKYRAAIELEPRELAAWKGLERIYAQGENYAGLIESLRAQVDLAATPKQRIALLERIGLLLEQEFLDHAQAAQCFEDIVAIDAGHDGANGALARLYRHLQRFEDLVAVLDRHSAVAEDDGRKIELLLQAARVYAVDLSSPQRAIELYEEILAIDEEQADALSELARLKTSAGDVAAAVAAVERLAEREQDPQKRAQLWIRAGKLSQDGTDRDRAITAYKRALDLDPHAAAAAEALREIYRQRGDARGAIEMLMHAIEVSEGELKRATLLAELGTIYKHQLDDTEQASVAFEQALSLDPTSTAAAAGLASIAFADERFGDAIEHYEQIEGRLDELPRDHGAELCVEVAQAYKALGDTDKGVTALERARELLPNDLKTAERYAQILTETGDHGAAERLYEKLLEQFDSELDAGDRARLLLRLGDAQLSCKRGKRALETFGRVLELRAEDPEALDGLTRAHEQAGDWNEVINLLQLRSRRAQESQEVFDLMVQTGDVFLEKLKDREAACQTYVMALDVRPDNRNLLTKLMGVYSDAKDWPRLIEIILRIAEMVKEPAALAKYYNTAATIAHQELGRFDEAANYYEEALSHIAPEEGDAQFKGLTACLTENQDWERLERAYDRRITRMRQAGVDGMRIAALLDACAEVVQNRLGRLADALRMYEEAMEIEPENEQRRAMLAAIYSKEPKRFFQRAVAAQRHYLDRDPYRVESLQALRRIYTSGKRPDESWCVCQALRCLKMADADEEKFFKKYRLTRLPKVKQPLAEDVLRELCVHPVQDPTLTAIFATLQPAVIAAQSQGLAAFGVHEQYRLDPNADPSAMARMIGHVGETLSMHLPAVYACPQDPGGLSFLFTAPPAIGIGEGAKAGGPQQALAFVAARHVSYYRQGSFLRQLVPTGTGLRGWLIGAIRTVVPRFPAPSNMESHVRECVEAIQRHLPGPQREALRSLTQKLLEAAPELDMKAWMAGVDLTADRVGFVLSNDLKIANAVIEASPEDASSVSRKDRMRELLAYSVSEPYFELRKRIGIALGG